MHKFAKAKIAKARLAKTNVTKNNLQKLNLTKLNQPNNVIGDGVSINRILNRFPSVDETEMRTLLAALAEDGYVFTSSDEDHFGCL